MTDTETPSPLMLYVLVRTDIPSMGAGKAAAQATHAGNRLTYKEVIAPLLGNGQANADVLQWSKEADGFGSTVTLASPTLEALDTMVQAAKAGGFPCGYVIDPTYPYFVSSEITPLIDPRVHTLDPVQARSGDFICFRKETTCAYVFGRKDALEPVVGEFEWLTNRSF